MFSLAQWPLIQVLLLVSDTCWSAGIASEETFWGGKGWGHKVFLKSHSDLFFIERLSHCISKRFCAPSLLNHCFFMSESSRSMKSQCNITSKAVAPRVKWRSRFKRAPSGLGENAFQHRWKFTIYIIFYVPNASLAQNSSSSGQRKPCKYYVKMQKRAILNWYSNGQVGIVLVKNEFQSISSWIESKSVWKSWKKSEMQLFANTKLVKNKYFTYIWPPKEVANWRKGEMPLCSRTDWIFESLADQDSEILCWRFRFCAHLATSNNFFLHNMTW